MKASELKLGDHFRAARETAQFPDERIVWVVLNVRDTHLTRRAVTAGRFQNSGRQIPIGYSCDRLRDADPLCELVPMPGPYVVGKAYRTRNGDTLFYVSSNGVEGSQWQRTHPHSFEKHPGRPIGTTATNEGRVSDEPDTDHAHDIMGEEAAKPLTLEVGKRYVGRDGKITGPLRESVITGYLSEAPTFDSLKVGQKFTCEKIRGVFMKTDGPVHNCHHGAIWLTEFPGSLCTITNDAKITVVE